VNPWPLAESASVRVADSSRASRAKNEKMAKDLRSVADMQAGGRYRVVGEATKQYVDTLCEETDRRRPKFTLIDWHR
jgi:hypothetical protein